MQLNQNLLNTQVIFKTRPRRLSHTKTLSYKEESSLSESECSLESSGDNLEDESGLLTVDIERNDQEYLEFTVKEYTFLLNIYLYIYDLNLAIFFKGMLFF